MKILFIGGTGTISMAISRRLLEQGHELYLINRGNRNAGLAAQLPGTGEWNRPKKFWWISMTKKGGQAAGEGLNLMRQRDFIALRKEHLERDYRLLRGKTKGLSISAPASACRSRWQII